MKRIAVLICTKDRPTELYGLLQSLRTQTIKDFDVYILDDLSGTPMNQYYFLNYMFIRMTCEGNDVFFDRTEFQHGVSRARQRVVDNAIKKDYEYFLRVDDDVLLESDYIEKLIEVLNKGYDIASGVTIPMMPVFKRNANYLKIANRIILDSEGKFLFNGDDCGMPYVNNQIVPAHHFRSCALIKREVHEKVKYYPTRLSINGYREEEVFSLKALIEGFKIGVNTSAINFHLMTPSGGERNTMNLAPFNQQILEEFAKENKDKLIPLTSKKEDIHHLEFHKENNLLR